MPFLTRWDDTSRPTVKEALRDAAVRAVAPGVLVWVVIVAIGLVIVGPLNGLESENAVNRWFQERRTPTGESVTHIMSTIGNTEYVIGVAVLVSLVVLWRTHRWWYAAIPLLAISLQSTIFVLAAWTVGRSRPNVERLDPTPPTSSFPSGHVGASTALYVAFALMATRIENVLARRVLVALCIVVPFLVGYARIYRGAHHVTDVVVGLLNGLCCAALSWGYLRRDGRDERSGQSRA